MWLTASLISLSDTELSITFAIVLCTYVLHKVRISDMITFTSVGRISDNTYQFSNLCIPIYKKVVTKK